MKTLVAGLLAALLSAGGDEAVEPLVQKLKEGATAEERAAAARALWKLGPRAEAAVPALVAALKDADGPVRSAAAFALGGVGAPAAPAAPGLLELLKASEPTARAAAAFALGSIGPGARAAAPVLVAALTVADPELQETAAWALGRIGPEAAAVAVPALIERLDDPSPRLQEAAVRALAALGPAAKEAAPVLQRRLADATPELRRALADALARTGGADSGAADALVARLRDKDYDDAIEALARADPAVAVPALARGLHHADKEVRERCCFALERIGPEKTGAAIPTLIEALDDREGAVRAMAARVLAWHGAKAAKAVPALIRAYEQGSGWVSAQAADTLRCLGPAAQAAVPALRKGLKDSDHLETRAMTARALWLLDPGGADMVPVLVEVLEQDDHGGRYSAIETLGWMKERARAAVPALRKMLEDPRMHYRNEVALNLFRIDPKQEGLVEVFLAKLREEHSGERWRAVKALEEMGPAAATAAPALEKLLEDEDPHVREAAASALARVRGK